MLPFACPSPSHGISWTRGPPAHHGCRGGVAWLSTPLLCVCAPETRYLGKAILRKRCKIPFFFPPTRLLLAKILHFLAACSQLGPCPEASSCSRVDGSCPRQWLETLEDQRWFSEGITFPCPAPPEGLLLQDKHTAAHTELCSFRRLKVCWWRTGVVKACRFWGEEAVTRCRFPPKQLGWP